MRTFVGVLILGSGFVVAAAVLRAAADPPAWAYGFTSPPPAAGTPRPAAAPEASPASDDGTPKRLPGSDQAFTVTQIHSPERFFNVIDWYPNDHPKMPSIVQYGKKPTVYACGLCHQPNGKGRPENAPVSGLPVAYFLQQLSDFKNDLRKSADPRKTNTNNMIAYAKNMSDAEMQAAAEYFGSMPWTPWIKVVETDTVPKLQIARGGMFRALGGTEKEPLGERIVEMPEKEEAEVLWNPRSGYVAYVPVGSIAKGEALVTTGGAGKTIQCGVCHGPDLKGLGPVPGIAGRSPSYVARQLYDMQQGTRKGLWTDLMKPVVAKLTVGDVLAVAAYTASRPAGTANTQLTPAGR